MQIGCTKKLQEFIQKDLAETDKQEDPFFSWSASLITVNRRKTIVVLQESTRCGFVLYGVTKKDLKNLEDTLMQGIREMLEAQNIKPEVIDQYLEDCGKQIIYTKTKNRTVVAQLNAFVQRTELFGDVLTTEHILQRHVLPKLNYNLIKQQGNQYVEVSDLVENEFKKYYRYGDVLDKQAATLDVQILDVPCKRRIRIPADNTLYQLHQVLQNIFAWQNEHLHEFRADEDAALDAAFPEYSFLARCDDWDMADTSLLEEYLTVADVFKRFKHLTYVYDFGDHWQHEITLVDMESAHQESCKPTCIIADGIAPPEDCGGSDGYKELCRILSDPHDEEYEETRIWAVSMGWREVCVDDINNALRHMIYY